MNRYSSVDIFHIYIQGHIYVRVYTHKIGEYSELPSRTTGSSMFIYVRRFDRLLCMHEVYVNVQRPCIPLMLIHNAKHFPSNVYVQTCSMEGSHSLPKGNVVLVHCTHNIDCYRNCNWKDQSLC